MRQARGITIVSMSFFVIIALAGFIGSFSLSRGQRVLDAHIIVATDDLRRVKRGDVLLSQKSGERRLEGALQIAEGSRGMMHSSARVFLVCGFLAVVGVVYQVILLRRLRVDGRSDDERPGTSLTN